MTTPTDSSSEANANEGTIVITFPRSPLTALKLEQHEKVLQWLATSTTATVVERIQSEFGIAVPAESLGWFYNGWQVFQVTRQAERVQKAVRELQAKLPELDLEDESLNLVAQAGYELEAMQTKDFERFTVLRKLRQKDRDQRLDERRVVLLEQKAAKADEAENGTRGQNLTEEEKQESINDIFGVKMPPHFQKGEHN